MTVNDHQQIHRAYSLPPRHLNTPRPRKVTHTTPSQTIPGEIMQRRNSTPGWMTQDMSKGKAYSQVKSKKMELKCGMSPLKTQQCLTDLIKSQEKYVKRNKESGNTNLESKFGRLSFSLPKINSSKISPTKLILGCENKTAGASVFRDRSLMPVLTQTEGDRNNVYTSRGDATTDQSDLETKLRNPKENKKSVIVTISDKNEDKEQPAKTIIKTKAVESQSKTLLRRSVSDLKQKSLAARKFLNYSGMRAEVCRSTTVHSVTNKSKGQNDGRMDLDDNSNDKGNIGSSYLEENAVDLTEESRKYGSILKRPGNKRKSIKHVEFLDNIGDDQDPVIRYI